MQNKPKVRKSQMNVNDDIKKDYENETLGERGKNKPKQTQPVESLPALSLSKCRTYFKVKKMPRYGFRTILSNLKKNL